MDKQSSVLAMMDSIGLCDTDFRKHVSQNVSVLDTQALLKLFLAALKKVGQTSGPPACASGSSGDPSLHGMVQDGHTQAAVAEAPGHTEEETTTHDLEVCGFGLQWNHISLDYTLNNIYIMG